jgi:hypothetical protein
MEVDQRVNSFKELQEALYEIAETKHRRHRSDYVYRGIDDCRWGLETSLQRLGPHYADVEVPLLRNFVKYAGPGEIPGDGLLFKLAVAQHHGLPTRVLDWTTAPRVAAHFATADEDHYDKDGAIWCVDVVRARERLPAELREILDDQNAFIFSVEMLERYRKITDLEQFRDDFVLFFEPPSLDQRIVNQGAVLSVLPNAGRDLKALLDEAADDGLYKRIVIPKEIKWEVRDKLDQDNVTERMLFPGLDGTSRWLKRYYGPGPTISNPALGKAE